MCLLSIDVSEEHVASIFRAEKIRERKKPVTIIPEDLLTSQKTTFFLVTAVETSNPTYVVIVHYN
jgi:hypothetical protein